MTVRRLAVLGSPIAHSQSPILHAAAYRVLGLDWSYEPVEVVEGALGAFLNSLDASWRGLSLTMPLKREVLPMLSDRSPTVELVGAANTVTLDDMRGFNTDVSGIVDALADHGVTALDRVHILGMGATAASALAAAARLGAREAVVTGRRRDDAELTALAARLALALRFRAPGDPAPTAELLVNTIPVAVEDVPEIDDADAFLEVIYGDGTTARAAHWEARGGTVITGLEMLLHQAIGQVRIFVSGEEDAALHREAEVVAAMRAAVGL